jgi:TRAP-type C4-dicarboxylate transport system substrate-binding protein
MLVTNGRTRLVAIALLVFTAVLSAACTVGSGSGDKAGGSGEPVVLRLSNGYSNLDYEPAVADFVARVEKLSGGTLRVEVVHERGVNSEPGFEQDIVRDVGAGKVDLAWVGTRVFDTLGVKSLQALTAPMLIDSYPLEEAVILSDIPTQMLKSVDKLGVTGLAVFADGLRKPIAVGRPLLGPADWRGLTFAAFRSQGQAEAIQSLGASPSELWGAPLVRGLADGEVQGFEKSLLIYHLSSLETGAPYVTANVNLWPQTVALVANPARLSALSNTQQGWVMQAAREAAVRSTSLVSDESRLVSTECQIGARFANASDADLAALREAFIPVYSLLMTDPQTKTFVESIEELRKKFRFVVGLPIPEGCTGAAPGQTLIAGGGDQSVMNGVYRVNWTEDELFAAGTTPVYAHGNYGVRTLTLTDGHYLFEDSIPGPPCEGSYAISGNFFSIDFNVGVCQGTATAKWELANGWLRFSHVEATDAGDEVVLGAKPWAKIANIPRPPRIADGAYRESLSEQFLIDAGLDPITSRGNAGLQTLTIEGNRWTFSVKNGEPTADCQGDLTYSGDRVEFIEDSEPECGNVTRGSLFNARWSLKKGELSFTDFQSAKDESLEVLFGSEPWKKIG